MKTLDLSSAAFTTRRVLAVCAVTMCVSTVFAQWPNLPTTPLSVQNVADPNLFLTLDDSGSMASAYAPDSISGISTEARWLSPRTNSMAYNPFEIYVAPYTTALDGTRMTTSFTSAPMTGYDASFGTVNLSTSYRPVFSFNPSDTSFNNVAELFQSSYIGGYTAQAAFIYSFYTDLSPTNTLPTPGTLPSSFARRTALPVGCPGPTAITNNACYIKVTIPAAHQSNFAIWYSFYKTRNLAVASSTNISFYGLSPRFRVTWQTLNKCQGFSGASAVSCQGYDNVVRANYLRKLGDTAHKTLFYQYLSRLPANSNTPLRAATERAGNFLKSTGINSPRANQLGVAEAGPGSAPISACRANFHVMLTDGIWNGTANSTSVGNADSTAQTLGDGAKAYVPIAPYADASSNSVADLAFAQWAGDADTSLNNKVPAFYFDKDTNTDYWDPRNDPATWQHMNTFAIGLGLGGFLAGQTSTAGVLPVWGGSTYAGDYPALKAGTMQWPTTGDDSPGNVADLWHAALNGRGEFFSADSPNAIAEAFRKILTRVASASTSSGQVATSSKRVNSGSLLFDVGYKTGGWYSTIKAKSVYSDGSEGPLVWSTDTTLTSDAPARNIFTWKPSTSLPRPFAWAEFTAAEKTSLFNNDVDLLNYLRGDRSNESTTSTARKFRQRTQLLGDVVGSELVASAKTDQGFEFLPTAAGGSTYRSFVDGKKSAVFVGANDGMVHGFAGTGNEVFAYIPSSVLPKIKDLSLSPMAWQPLVDGPLTLGDIYVGGAWKTVLVGGVGGGGAAVFGLDVTGVTQNSGSGSFTASNVLFDVSDPEMGFSFSKPVIGRTATGQWVAIWGNGYGGLSKKAYLFVYNFSTSTLSKIDTGVGAAADPNGLGSPVGVEFTSGNIMAVYAGDYKGNLWKFNLNTTSGAFQLANGSTPFFIAKDSSGKAQPITAAPEVALHPAGGVMVMFGTGKFFEAQDRSTRDVQTFYAVRDTGQTTSAQRAALVQQTITAGTDLSADNRAVSVNPVDYAQKRGWYIDFTTTIGTSASGERVIARPILLGDNIAFVTYAPGVDDCEGTGLGVLMFANVFVGGLPSPFLDTNGDGFVNSADKPASGNNISGIKISGSGSLSSPVATLVGVQPRGTRGTRPAGLGCGGLGEPPCAANTVRPGCEAGLTEKAGFCRAVVCNRGSLLVQAGATQQCAFSSEVRYPRWMELKWK